MARAKKINWVRRQPIQYYKVKIDVDDPGCLFSIKPQISYMRVVKATSENAAVRAAANYCTKYMKEYPGVIFKYSTKEVEEYQYHTFACATKEDL
jgi:hypothetical protein